MYLHHPRSRVQLSKKGNVVHFYPPCLSAERIAISISSLVNAIGEQFLCHCFRASSVAWGHSLTFFPTGCVDKETCILCPHLDADRESVTHAALFTRPCIPGTHLDKAAEPPVPLWDSFPPQMGVVKHMWMCPVIPPVGSRPLIQAIHSCCASDYSHQSSIESNPISYQVKQSSQC